MGRIRKDVLEKKRKLEKVRLNKNKDKVLLITAAKYANKIHEKNHWPNASEIFGIVKQAYLAGARYAKKRKKAVQKKVMNNPSKFFYDA